MGDSNEALVSVPTLDTSLKFIGHGERLESRGKPRCLDSMICGEILRLHFCLVFHINSLGAMDPRLSLALAIHSWKEILDAEWTAPIAKSLASHISSKGKSQSGAIKIGASVNFLLSVLKDSFHFQREKWKSLFQQ
ncbi:hypothetical protein Tco_0168450 [Tanacetum coccineum]